MSGYRHDGAIDFTDLFCGAGGSSTGLVAAGFTLKLAANHWERAIETHSANHRDAEHLCTDIDNYDMRRLPKTTVLWASPICTEASPAGGRPRRPKHTKRGVRGQLGIEEFGHVPQAGFERTRATFWDVIRAAEVHRYPVVLVENVWEVTSEWELFDVWLLGMKTLGYTAQFVSISSAHAGGAGNTPAPQWRDRIYIVFTLDGIPLPDVEPRPLAWCPTCEQDVHAVQVWNDPNARHLGKYRKQYRYRCPNSACWHREVEPYVRPAASIIDWADLGTRIGDRPRPLAAATIARIRAGLELIADRPSMMTLTHGGADPRTADPWGVPFPARTSKIGEGLVVPNSAIVRMRNHDRPAGPEDPLSTIAAGGNHHGLVVPDGAFYVKQFTPRGNPAQMCKPVDQPLGSITTSDHHSLVIPYRRGSRPRTAGEPMHTLHTRDSAAPVRAAGEVNDCYFRMFKPREHLSAQRFPADYIVHGNKGEQTMQAGNAVSVNAAQWLGERILAALA